MKLLKEKKKTKHSNHPVSGRAGLGSREQGGDGRGWILMRTTPAPTAGRSFRDWERCLSCVTFNSRDRGFLPGCPVPTGQCSRQKSHPKVKRVPLERSSLFQYFSSTIPRAVPKGVQGVKDPRHSTQFFPMGTTHSTVVPRPKPFSSWTT